MIIQQARGAPSQHDPNEALDQISEDNLTQDAPQEEDKATRTARRARNQRKGEHKVRAAERARLPLRNLNQEDQEVSSIHRPKGGQPPANQAPGPQPSRNNNRGHNREVADSIMDARDIINARHRS